MDTPYPGLDGDDAQSIVADVGNGTAPEESRVDYGDVELRFRRDVEVDWNAWLEAHPDAVLDVPNELPRADTVIGKKRSLLAAIRQLTSRRAAAVIQSSGEGTPIRRPIERR